MAAKTVSTEQRLTLRLAIAALTEKLRSLDEQRVAVERELRRLNSELDALQSEDADRLGLAPVAGMPAPVKSADKVALFRSRFRGRDDVYATRWSNSRNGRAGYAPACDSEWVPNICNKPRVKCGECPNQAFLPVCERTLLDHLQGRHVVGIYPLLRDETCWLLAADFDKRSWMDDVSALRAACDATGVPVAIERSRSGNGAHAWFFFETPVPAASARRFGYTLITHAMSLRHQLDMASYDRLFPNQDTMPRGGFGNLIALPLQHDARANGNSVFVDDSFTPYEEQWAFLAKVPRIPKSIVNQLAAEAVNEERGMGMPGAGEDETHEAATPWRTISPRGLTQRIATTGTLPRQVESVLADRLYVSRQGLDSSVLAGIKRLAAFGNPEFYKKQRMRLSTALTPRVIACAEDHPEHVSVPRGCVTDVSILLESLRSMLVVDDQRQIGSEIEQRFHGSLTSIQEGAVRALLAHDTGVFVAPPGIGKTVTGIALIAERRRNTLVLVHRQPLLDQRVAQLALFLDVPAKSIGRIGGGKRHVTGQIDVAMIQSLIRKDAVADLVGVYGHVVVDECHHLPAVSFERVLATIKARYLTGLTATPRRRDGLHPILAMQLGPSRFVVDPRAQAARSPFRYRLIVRETAFTLPEADGDISIQAIYQRLADDDARNELILNDVIQSLAEGRSPIVLTERRSHLEFFAERLRGFTRHLVVLSGGTPPKKRQEILESLSSIPDAEERLVLATGRYIGEGFDDARLDTLFLTLPISWKGTLVQYAGRLHRLHRNKIEVRIYDYVDGAVPALARMFKRRRAGYRAIGYE